MKENPSTPSITTTLHLEFLDELRQSGTTNMFGASSHLREEFPELGTREANQILVEWMASFGDRHHGT